MLAVTPRTVAQYPMSHPELAIVINEEKDGSVQVVGLDVPAEQLERLQDLLEAWKYGIVEAE